MNYSAIWIDIREALIVNWRDGKQSMLRVRPEREIGNVKGGSGSSTPFSPQDAVSESKFLEKRKHNFKKYFDAITEKVSDAEVLLLTGPAQMKNELFQDLIGRHDFKNASIYQETVDKMTDNQFKALARDFFSTIVN